MAKHSSATMREQTPHGPRLTTHTTRTTRTATIMNALARRAQVILNDETIDAQSRAIIRYSLETNDPWLAELVRRADAGEEIVNAIDFSETPPTGEEDSSEEKIAALAEIICSAAKDAKTKSAALLVLMATLENSMHPKVLANRVKHVVFTCCGELNLNRMVDVQLARPENELLMHNAFTS